MAATKQLTVKLKADTSDINRKLDAVVKKINSVNAAVNKSKHTDMSTGIDKAAKAANAVKNNIDKASSSTRRLSSLFNGLSTKLNTIRTKFSGFTNSLSGKFSNLQGKFSSLISKTNRWASSTKKVNGGIKGVVGSLTRAVAKVAALVFSWQTLSALIRNTDLITSAKNKMNYVHASQLGDGGFTADGSGYSSATLNATQEALDKMYVSAQKTRVGYTDMMSNVSKSMALAGDAFQNSTDNAIRFQEIMAKTYTLGGASAQEMSNSMYQMIQALGAGTLAGDELRSVREGAPLAYKAIEEFAQGVLHSEDSLKDLASQGKITSEMVVAAIMDASDEIDKAFEKTDQTFEQTWNQIKNSAIKAFEPVSTLMTKLLNDLIDAGLISKIEMIFSELSKWLQIIIAWTANLARVIADNWHWIKLIVGTALLFMIALTLKWMWTVVKAATVAAAEFLWSHKILLVVCAAVVLLIWVFNQWRNSAIDTCTAIAYGVLIIGVAIGLIMLLMGNLWGLLVIAIAAILFLIIKFFDQVCGYAWVAITFIGNLIQSIVNFCIGLIMVVLITIVNVFAFIVKSFATVVNVIATLIQWIVAFTVNLASGCANFVVAISHNAVAGILNGCAAIGNWISALCQNISIMFQNAWNGALSAFWNFIADCLEGLDWLAKPLAKIAELFGKDFDYESFSSSVRSKASGYTQKEYVSMSNAFSAGLNTYSYKNPVSEFQSGWNSMDYANMGDMAKSGWNVVDFASYEGVFSTPYAGTGLSDYSWKDAYNAGSDWGAGIMDGVNDWGSGVADEVNSKLKYGGHNATWMDATGKTKADVILDKLGVNDLYGDNGTIPNSSNPYNNVSSPFGSSYDPAGLLDSINNDTGNIADSTGSISDSLDMTDEDIEYLRKIAEMEWKKEYTTAQIKIDMSNYNTISNDYDLDDFISKVTDGVYESLDNSVNGVYAL